jgi:hypothetical protein
MLEHGHLKTETNPCNGYEIFGKYRGGKIRQYNIRIEIIRRAVIQNLTELEKTWLQ